MTSLPTNAATHCIEDMFNCGSAVTVRVCPESCRYRRLCRLSGSMFREVPFIRHTIASAFGCLHLK